MDFEKLRKDMVETQLLPRGINDPEIIAAFLKVPRHLFMPEDLSPSAYQDDAMPIGNGQTISQPFVVAAMTQYLELKKIDRVLEIGTGSGYQAAILAELASEVYSIERIETLAAKAKKTLLDQMQYTNIHIFVKDGTEGLAELAPFNAILVTAACPDIPPPLIEQLAIGGRMVLPLGDRYSQIMTVVTKTKRGIEVAPTFPCVFVPLLGKYGWK